jgi:tRNA(fMet)-specific endonuclease VapC
MPKVLLDTDILSGILKCRDVPLARWALVYQETYGRFTTSTITVVEIAKGFQRIERYDALTQFLASMPLLEVLPLDVEAAVVAGRIYGDLERAGQPIGRADPMIAGIAIRHGLPLVTGNRNHFQRVQQLGYALKLEDWRS